MAGPMWRERAGGQARGTAEALRRPLTVPVDDGALDARTLVVARLVADAQAGDRDAFDELVAHRLDAAFRVALGILGDEADARDATQDAFVASWRQLRRLREPARFDGWFGRILVNCCREQLRRRRRTSIREIRVRDCPDGDEPVGRDRPIDEQAVELDAIERAFGRLSVPDRAILVLHHVERQPLAIIAATLRVPVGTAKSRLFAARRALEHALEAER